MIDRLSTVSFSPDPLIAEAKQRTRRRRLLVALVVVLVAGAALGATLSMRGSTLPGDAARPGAHGRAAVRVRGVGTLTDNASHSYIAYGVALVSAKEREVQLPVPVGGTLSDLTVLDTTAPGTGARWTSTIDKNGTSTAMTCSIAGHATKCRDSSRVALAIGDKLDLDVTPFGAPALTTITWSAKIKSSRS